MEEGKLNKDLEFHFITLLLVILCFTGFSWRKALGIAPGFVFIVAMILYLVITTVREKYR